MAEVSSAFMSNKGNVYYVHSPDTLEGRLTCFQILVVNDRVTVPTKNYLYLLVGCLHCVSELWYCTMGVTDVNFGENFVHVIFVYVVF